MTEKTVHVVGGFPSYERMFVQHNWVSVDCVEDADLVLFCGGPDVWPGFYGEQVHKSTRYNIKRDDYEKLIFELAVDNKCGIAGVCRGAQFVHVMNGGWLYQDVNGHATGQTHATYCISEYPGLNELFPEGLQVSSTHHQQMRDNCGEIILGSWISTAKHTANGLVPDGSDHYSWDVEAMWHPYTRSFCYQPHPEYFNQDHPCQRFFFQALKRLVFGTEQQQMKEAS